MRLHTSRRLLLLFPAVLAGCGLGAYEERLQRTDERNAYFAHLDEVLQPSYWNQSQYQIWLRPPQGLSLMPEPKAPPPTEEGEQPEPPPDPRLEFQGTPLDLPGLIEAWEGKLPVAGGGMGEYRLYLLGNHSRFIGSSEQGAANPKEYFADLEVALQNLFQVQLPSGDGGRSSEPNVRYRQQIPASERFSLIKNFTAANFIPAEGAFAEGTGFRGWLYEYTNGPIQVAVLMLTPENPSLDVQHALQTSLETLRVSPQPPRVQGGRRGGAPSGGGTGGRGAF